METSIYYFSGTGNSLYLAKKLSEGIPGSNLYSIPKFQGGHVVSSEVLGLVFPTHALDVPVMVKDFIQKVDVSKVKYIFSIVTCGDKIGNTIVYLDELLRSKKSKLDYGLEVKLADNSIYYKTPDIEIEKRFKELDTILARASCDILNRNRNIDSYSKFTKWSFMSVALKMAMKYYLKDGKKKVSSEKCIRCGLCEKICPSKNISNIDGNMVFGENCVNCYGCINWCPKEAISFGKINVHDGKQYRCAGIKADELKV